MQSRDKYYTIVWDYVMYFENGSISLSLGKFKKAFTGKNHWILVRIQGI